MLDGRCNVSLGRKFHSAVRTDPPRRGIQRGRQTVPTEIPVGGDYLRAQPADPQTEFALLRESLGVSRINHILRVHGHTILQEQRAAEIYDEVGQPSLERLFSGFTEDSLTQTTLNAGQSGIGYERARDIAAPAHLKALVAARPRIQAMIQDAATAGLLPKHLLETRRHLHLPQRP